MDRTLTLRLSAAQRAALRRRAQAEGKSESAVVRQLLEQDLDRGFEFARVQHLVGVVSAPVRHWEKDAWRSKIRQHNWR